MKDRARIRFEQLQADSERPSIAKELLALDGLCDKKIITPEEFSVKKDELLEELMKD